MARDWKWSDIFGIGNLTGDPDPIFGELTGANATKDAMAAQQAALDKAMDVIMGASGKALDLQNPFMENAGADFSRQRGLINQGFFQAPYAKGFTSQQFTPQGYSFNPRAGQASFSPWRPQGGPATFQAQALPGLPAMPTVNPVTQQIAPGPGLIPQRAMEMVNQIRPETPVPTQVPPGMNPGLMGYNPQTGTGSPLTQIGAKPADPRLPTLEQFLALRAQNPNLRYGSGAFVPTMTNRRGF